MAVTFWCDWNNQDNDCNVEPQQQQQQRQQETHNYSYSIRLVGLRYTTLCGYILIDIFLCHLIDCWRNVVEIQEFKWILWIYLGCICRQALWWKKRKHLQHKAHAKYICG